LNIKDSRDFGLGYFLYLSLVDVLYNMLEEYSVKRSYFTQFAKVAGDRFIQVHELKKEGREDEVLLPILDIVEKFRQIITQDNCISEREEELPYRGRRIPFKLSIRDDEYYVGGYPQPFFFNLDELLLMPERVKMIGRAFVKEVRHAIKEEGANKLCFIEKLYGPIGAITLLPYLVEKTGLPAVIYRPLHWKIESKVTGDLRNSDKICIVYDLAVTGGALMDTTYFLESNYPGLKVVSAIVLYDYMAGAKEKLHSKYGVKLRPIVNLSQEKIRKIFLNNYERERDKISNKILEGKITYKKYLEEVKSLFNRFADYQLFASE
jgi:orotate phosphoribosyltransferase